MTISLVSAPVLGFDLVRHPRGRAIAATLLWALSLGPDDLPVFSAELMSGDPLARAAAWANVTEAQADVGPGLLNGSALAEEGTAAPAGSMAAVIHGLRRSMFIAVDDLEYLVRSDVLAWAASSAVSAQPAVDLLVGALAADWVDGLDDVTRRELGGGIEEIRARLGDRAYDIGPCADEVTQVLDTVRTLDADARAGLREANTLVSSAESGWAQAVHQASWAAFTTGRIRSAASAQLLAVQAFLDGGLDATDGIEGVWNLISGHVQACVVADVLPAEIRESLARGWSAAL